MSMKDMGIINCSTAQAIPLIVGKDTVYVHTDIEQVKTDSQGKPTENISGYMSKPQGTTKTGFLAKEVSGSATTYFCDFAALFASCVASFGGGWNSASATGAFQLSANDASSNSNAYVAARLMFL